MSGVELSLENTILEVERDFDSSLEPNHWIWLMFDTDSEPWFKLSIPEATALRDALSKELFEVES